MVVFQRSQGLPLLSGVPRRTTSSHRLRVHPVPLRGRRRLPRLGDRRPRHQDRVLHGEGRQEDRYLPPGGRPGARYREKFVSVNFLSLSHLKHSKLFRYFYLKPHLPGWDKIQTIDSLLKKGGYKGAPTPEVRRSIRLTRYQSEKVTVAYSDYLLHCRHVHSNRTIEDYSSTLYLIGFRYLQFIIHVCWLTRPKF